jgi:hypothetical protein
LNATEEAKNTLTLALRYSGGKGESERAGHRKQRSASREQTVKGFERTRFTMDGCDLLTKNAL